MSLTIYDARAALAEAINSVVDSSFREGQQTERERIRARVFAAANKTWQAGDTYIGPPHWTLNKFVDELLEEDGDE